MRRTFVLLLVAVIFVVVAIIAMAPASLLGSVLEGASQGKISATSFEGTVWRGRAQLVSGESRLPVAWTLDAMPLLSGEVRLELRPEASAARALRGDVRASRDHLALTSVDVALPAAAIAALLPRGSGTRPAWALAGDIAVTSPSLDWTPTAVRGELGVDWRAAALLPTGMRPIVLGDVGAKLAGDGTKLAGPVTNRGGDLDLSGDIAVGANGAASLSLLLVPRRADDVELTRALGAVGIPEGNGWRIAWQGKAR